MRRHPVSLQAQVNPRPLSLGYSDRLDRPTDSIASIDMRFGSLGNPIDAFPSEIVSWAGCNNFSNVFEASGERTIPNFNKRRQDTSVASTWGMFLNHADLGLPWDQTEPLLYAQPPMDLVSENTASMWTNNFGDSLGVLGTDTESTSTPYIGKTPAEANWGPFLSSSEEAQVLYDAFIQPNMSHRRNFNPLQNTNVAPSQASASGPFDTLSADNYGVRTTSADGNELSATSNQVSNLEETSPAVSYAAPGAVLQPTTTSVSIFETGRIEETSTLPLIQPTADPHHVSSLYIIHDSGLGELRAENGMKMLRRGRRKPLPREKALRIAKARRERTVCLICRMKKVAVSYKDF